MRIVILSAFQDESEKIKRHFPARLEEKMISKCRCLVARWGAHDVTISQTGIGTTASAITTTILCEKLDPDLIIFCGVAGGLKPDQQQIGDLVLANQIIDADLHQLPAALEETPYKNALMNPHTLKSISVQYLPHKSIMDTMSSFSFERLTSGIIVTSNTFPAPPHLFSEIQKLGCSAIEMESSGVFGAAEPYGVPVLTMRAISNLLDETGQDLGTQPDALEICADKLAQGLSAILENLQSVEAYADANQQTKLETLIHTHKLEQHPEGGWYRELFCSDTQVKAEKNCLTRYSGESRAAGSAILYMLSQDDFSAWHTIQSDETWSFHTGDDLLLRVIDPKQGELNEIILGAEGKTLQCTIKAGHVFSAQPLGRFCLMGCVVTPGFDFKDFKLLTEDEFITTYPQHADLAYLTRDKPASVAKTINKYPTRSEFFETIVRDGAKESSSAASSTGQDPAPLASSIESVPRG